MSKRYFLYFSLGPKWVRLSMLLQSTIKPILKVNIFNSHPSNEREQKNGIISTKIYFIVLMISLIVFGSIISLEKHSVTKIVYNPTRFQFDQLINDSISDLRCPCSKISIKYSDFVSYDPTYHQICSSVFTSPLWYDAYEIWNNQCGYISFPNLANFFFSLLSTFCQSANETVMNSLTQFSAREYITSEVVVQNQFNGEVSSSINLFEAKTQQSFKEQLSLIRSMLFGNQIISALRTNADFHAARSRNTVEIYSTFATSPDCSCGTDPTCSHPVGFCISDVWRYIPGIYSGCYMIDFLLTSTTECFFTQRCLALIKEHMMETTPLYKQLHLLNRSITSRYKINETIGAIVGNLFIEDWNQFYSYDQYFDKCKPSVCSYTEQQQKPSYIYVLTKLISVYGGLTILFRFLVPNIINLIRREKRRQPGIYLSSIVSIFPCH